MFESIVSMLQWNLQHTAPLKKSALWLGFSLVAAFFIFFGSISPSQAQSVADPNSSLQQGLAQIERPLGLPARDIRLIVANIIKIALSLIGTIFVILIIYGGYLWMTAGGNGEQIDQAKQVLKNGVIGLVIILSAYSIVLFVMRLLGIGEAANGNGTDVGTPATQNYLGSGGLGGIIKDHYPERNQMDVPRNTKIIVTFRRPIQMASLAEDTNKNNKLGDCINIGQNMNWQTDCDSLRFDNEHMLIAPVATGTKAIGAAVLASPDSTGKVFTVVIRPHPEAPARALGNDDEKTAYAVRIGKEVRLDDAGNNNPSIFRNARAGNDFYEWRYTYSTELDTKPPHVSSVFPSPNTNQPKNVVIQIDFSEAMDPTNLQGGFEDGGKQYVITGNTIFLKKNNSTKPIGNMTLTNGYRTLEFTSTSTCGVNACGSPIYCLPVCDSVGASCTADLYRLLLRAAIPSPGGLGPFEAIPFSGIMDASGNALDGNNNGKVDAVRREASIPIFDEPGAQISQEQADNYFWGFNLQNFIEKTTPYLQEAYPGLDATNVRADETVRMTFSRRMRVEPMYTINISEEPPSPNGVPMCVVPRVDFKEDGITATRLEHCPFRDATRTYYYPLITSAVEDVYFNCFFPGKGPNTEAVQKTSLVCQEDGAGCCSVTTDPNDKPFCCNGVPSANGGAECVSRLK